MSLPSPLQLIRWLAGAYSIGFGVLFIGFMGHQIFKDGAVFTEAQATRQAMSLGDFALIVVWCASCIISGYCTMQREASQ